MKRYFLLSSCLVSSVFGQNNQPNIPPEIATPPSVETRLGKLEFPLGVPAQKTVETLYNHIDYLHGINSFLTASAGASAWAMREGFLKAGVQDNDVLIFSKLMDAKSLFLKATLLSYASTAPSNHFSIKPGNQAKSKRLVMLPFILTDSVGKGHEVLDFDSLPLEEKMLALREKRNPQRTRKNRLHLFLEEEFHL